MDAALIVLGVIVLLLTLLDTFLAVLNYDEGGLFVDKIVRGQWLVMRAITRRVDRRWRPLVLRQVTGVLLLTTIFWWLLGILLGFALIYLGAMGFSGAFQISPGVKADFWGALYLSTGQFSTVGVDNISPGVPVLELLTVIEAMVSIVLLSIIITFLGSAYGVIQSLRALSANFFRIGRGVGDPIETLQPFFPDGPSRGLDSQLGAISDALSAYAEGLAQNRAAYYFQSGRDQFSLPFSLYMTAGVIGALQWGLPAGSDPTKEPNLARLGQTYEDFRLRTQRMLGLRSATPRPPVSAAEFSTAMTTFDSADAHTRSDAWVMRFLAINRRMAELTQSSAVPDSEEMYRRYTAWLAFEVEARAFTTAVGSDLDYQPIYRGVATTPDDIPLSAADAAAIPVMVGPTASAEAPAAPTGNPLGRWLRRRTTVKDPGLVRLADAVRSLVAAIVAVGIAVPLASLAGLNTASAATFAGLISLFSAPATAGGRAGGKWWAGTVAALPAIVGASCGVLIPRTPVSAVFELALVAALAMWLRRFGPAVGGLGQLGFVTYYVTALLGMNASDLTAVLVAAGVGVLASWIVGLIPRPSVVRQIDDGIDALYERVAALIDGSVDLVATGRLDARLIRSLRAGQSALVQAAGSVAGHLDADTTPGIPAGRARALRVRVFDLQLAAQSLVTMLPVTASLAITVDERARLAADLLDLQQQLAAYRPGAPAKPPAPRATPSDPPPDWPRSARAILATIGELRTAIDRLRAAQKSDDAAEDAHPQKQGLTQAKESEHGRTPEREQRSASAGRSAAHASSGVPEGTAVAHARRARAGAGTSGRRPAQPPGALSPGGREAARAADKQAVQAAISTGLALFLGGFVSTGHQYWAAMPAFQVLSGSDAETRSKGFMRIVATIAASGIAFGLAIVADHTPAVAIPLLLISAFAMSYMRAVSSAWLAFWATLLLATVYDLLGTLSVETVEVRLAETAIGSLVAVAVSAVVLPTRTRTRVLHGMAGVLDQASALGRALFGRLQGAQAPTAAELSHMTRALGAQLADLEKLAHPIRRNPGSLQPAGIQAQLTSLWALLDHEGHLVRLLRTYSPDAAAPRWRELAAATGDNFDAVRRVLTGSLPHRVHLPAELEDAVGEVGSDAERTVILQILRMNQTLLALLDAVAPGTVESMTNPDAAAGDARQADRSGVAG
ncbi:FUSC family protein [Microbacterium sp. zg.B48]|uniref:FUSC family protein n=1 Tax=unclassified Microbacterium TaxID=2609290 RepID=UPI00214BD2C2|nr:MULTISPECIES: FUSC family protein [unclassified Microbacterium]MCR2764827.1 FUSC family protein [Microbacterium sp. zg.B48]MCR2810034.1 FUSC family protein [Microbacterium sp. zg.B185]WIM20126.1 FUSC family protein [Microbacterium sp. zg-B185]